MRNHHVSQTVSLIEEAGSILPLQAVASNQPYPLYYLLYPRQVHPLADLDELVESDVEYLLLTDTEAPAEVGEKGFVRIWGVRRRLTSYLGGDAGETSAEIYRYEG
jgi:hypothetical protein